MQFLRFSNFARSSVAMSWHWAVQRAQNKDQRHSTPFKESRTRTKHIVPLSTKHVIKKFGAVGAMAPTPLSLKTRREGGLGGSHTRTAPPPPWVHMHAQGYLHCKPCTMGSTKHWSSMPLLVVPRRHILASLCAAYYHLGDPQTWDGNQKWLLKPLPSQSGDGN